MNSLYLCERLKGTTRIKLYTIWLEANVIYNSRLRQLCRYFYYRQQLQNSSCLSLFHVQKSKINRYHFMMLTFCHSYMLFFATNGQIEAQWFKLTCLASMEFALIDMIIKTSLTNLEGCTWRFCWGTWMVWRFSVLPLNRLNQTVPVTFSYMLCWTTRRPSHWHLFLWFSSNGWGEYSLHDN
mgnify:CR=1 FL=1